MASRDDSVHSGRHDDEVKVLTTQVSFLEEEVAALRSRLADSPRQAHFLGSSDCLVLAPGFERARQAKISTLQVEVPGVQSASASREAYPRSNACPLMQHPCTRR